MEFEGDYFKHYMEAKTMSQGFIEGRATLKALGMDKLLLLTDYYMSASLVKTDPRDFTLCGSFLQGIMALAGYGRALNFASSPRSAPPLASDELGLASEIESMIINLDSQARAKGFHPPVDGKWIPTCISSLKSTSAGVAPIPVELIIRGRRTNVKLRKKAAIGVVMGKTAFTKSELAVVVCMKCVV